MRWAVVAVILAAIFAAETAHASEIGGSVAMLTDAQKTQRCSGFWIDRERTRVGDAWFVSAGHCAKRGLNIAWTEDGERRYKVAWVVEVETDTMQERIVDTAIGLTSSIGLGEGLPLARSMPQGGEVSVVGFPGGRLTRCGASIMGMVEPEAPGSVEVKVHEGCAMGLGSSGAPVLDGEGRIVGVVWGLVRSERGALMATPIERLREVLGLLDSWLRGGEREDVTYEDE